MIRLQPQPMETIADLHAAVQKAIQLEFSTLPPYLYALFTVREGTNSAARARLSAVIRDEMVHLGLACNILNAIGGRPVLADASVLPSYPGPLPYDIGAEQGDPFIVSLLPFCEAAMRQAMRIEEPEERLTFPAARAARAARAVVSFETIGEFYAHLDEALGRLPPDAWAPAPRNQLGDHPFFAGDLFPVLDHASAKEAIHRIVSEGEGTTLQPLDFEGEVGHFYRFEELARDQALLRDPAVAEGFSWGGSLDVDRAGVINAIADPATYDFSGDPAAQEAQDTCDRAFTAMVVELERAVNGEPGRLGNAVRAMFDLRMAARAALLTPLEGRDESAGPAFRHRPELA
jgi:hypothetical protein